MKCKSLYWLAFMMCFFAIGCDNTDDGSYVEPITLYEKVNGNWGLTNLKMVDEVAKANKIEPNEENLSTYFNYEDFKIKSASVKHDKKLGATIWEIKVAGQAGATTPKKAGQLNGAPVLGYVFPTTLKPTDVGFNKTDVQKHDFAEEWMRDFEAYADVLQKEKTYSSSLAYSMSLVLDEFYQEISAVGVSALSGEGVEDLMKAFENGRKEYFEFYAKEIEERRQEYEAKKEKKEEENMQKLAQDLKDRVTMKNEGQFEEEGRMKDES